MVPGLPALYLRPGPPGITSENRSSGLPPSRRKRIPSGRYVSNIAYHLFQAPRELYPPHHHHLFHQPPNLALNQPNLAGLPLNSDSIGSFKDLHIISHHQSYSMLFTAHFSNAVHLEY
ncbi:hypothetical protein ABKN59_008675 [Abortiporus biennis]